MGVLNEVRWTICRKGVLNEVRWTICRKVRTQHLYCNYILIFSFCVMSLVFRSFITMYFISTLARYENLDRDLHFRKHYQKMQNFQNI